MAKGDNFYKMLVFLEEPLETSIVNEDNKEKPQKTHEFIEELVLPFDTDELDKLNEWFDEFDEKICIPNEGHIKYEISSDGLVVLLLEKEIEHVVEMVKEFVNDH